MGNETHDSILARKQSQDFCGLLVGPCKDVGKELISADYADYTD